MQGFFLSLLFNKWSNNWWPFKEFHSTFPSRRKNCSFMCSLVIPWFQVKDLPHSQAWEQWIVSHISQRKKLVLTRILLQIPQSLLQTRKFTFCYIRICCYNSNTYIKQSPFKQRWNHYWKSSIDFLILDSLSRLLLKTNLSHFTSNHSVN